MASLSISNAVAGLDGIEFTGTAGALQQRFVLYRDGLEDLEYQLFETDEALMKAFLRHKLHIAKVAAKALDEGKAGPRMIVLQSLLL
jgi:hypothetical protein